MVVFVLRRRTQVILTRVQDRREVPCMDRSGSTRVSHLGIRQLVLAHSMCSHEPLVLPYRKYLLLASVIPAHNKVLHSRYQGQPTRYA
jgi:hypothetical protein